MSQHERVAQHLGDIDTITIVTTRRDGTTVPTFIWSVAVDGVGYLRSAFGPDSLWYGRAVSGRPVLIDLGADGEVDGAGGFEPVPVTVEIVPADDAHAAEHAAIDAALTEKYGYTPKDLAPMLTAEATACTLRVR